MPPVPMPDPTHLEGQPNERRPVADLLPRLSLKASRRVNALGVLLISLVLVFTYMDEVRHGLTLCTLCIMQRMALFGVATGACLNLRFGRRTSHYAIAIGAAMAGAMVTARQILLHVATAPAAHDDLSHHISAHGWVLTTFVLLIAAGAFLVLLDRGLPARRGRRLSALGMTALFIISLMALVNGLSTWLVCGIGPCPAEPSAVSRPMP